MPKSSHDNLSENDVEDDAPKLRSASRRPQSDIRKNSKKAKMEDAAPWPTFTAQQVITKLSNFIMGQDRDVRQLSDSLIQMSRFQPTPSPSSKNINYIHIGGCAGTGKTVSVQEALREVCGMSDEDPCFIVLVPISCAGPRNLAPGAFLELLV